MKSNNKTPLDLLDDIFSLAWWMTGNEAVSQEIVNKTYLSAKTITRETELLKSFRRCYVEQFGQYSDFCISEKECDREIEPMNSMKQWTADIKLSVLLSEISGLQHHQISEIVGKPLDTIRTWLFWGRKLLVNTNPLKASA
ncbi:MAG: RNA polymerase subunit sigma-24 [Chlorobium sp.]|nr:MAG: RNA polymerase subunit sigma-24 [Chlorobium sp.]